MSDFDLNAMVQEQDGLPSRPAPGRGKATTRRSKRSANDDRPSLAGSKNKDAAIADEFFDRGLIEEPTDTAELYAKKKKRAKRLKIYVYAVMYFFFPMVLLVNFVYLGNTVVNREPVAVETAHTHSPRKAMAVQEVTSYLNQDPTPLPGVSLSGWDYVESTADGKKAVEQAETPPENLDEALAEAVSHETHYLSLVSETGALYTAAVEIAFSDTDGAWVTAPVSVTSQTPPASNVTIATGETFPGRTQISGNTSTVEAAVQTWSESFFSADPARLKQAVGDGRDTTSYMPMPKAANTEVSVSAMAVGDGATYNEDQELYDRTLARVTVTVTWPDTSSGIAGLVNKPEEAAEEDDDAEASEHVAEFSYDVLLYGSDTATPRVVAWGHAGSADELDEFSNAIEYRELKAEQE